MTIIDTEHGEIVIPESFRLEADTFCVSIHFNRGDRALLEGFAQNGFNAVHLNSGISGLSNQFRRPFQDDPTLFFRVLTRIEQVVGDHFGRSGLRIDSISISAFSAGYAAVKEILKIPELEPRVKSLFMVDTLYADWICDEVRVPLLGDVLEFMLFAQAAARGDKSLVVTHADYDCDHAGYCSTRKTADLLLASVGGTRQPIRRAIGGVSSPASRCDVGQFHLRHFATRDHHSQLKLLPGLWREFGLGLALKGED
jgi:hypothetical protein